MQEYQLLKEEIEALSQEMNLENNLLKEWVKATVKPGVN
jgi:hypothetical protein